MATVDARGFSCPVPLLMVQEEIKKSDPAELEVLIDAPAPWKTSSALPITTATRSGLKKTAMSGY